MTDSTSTTHDRTSSNIEDLKSPIREAEQALGCTDGASPNNLDDLRDRFREVLAEGQSKMKHLAAAARRQAGHADEVIRANPYPSIGIAAGVGLIVGFLISRASVSNR